MKKIAFCLSFLCALLAFQAQAQFSVGATVGPQIPLGEFGEGFGVGFGFNLQGKYAINEQLNTGLNIGYNSFGASDSDIDASTSITPITGFIEYVFASSGKIKPFVSADLGIYSIRTRVNVDFGFGSNSVSASRSFFGLAPAAGVLYGLNDAFSLNGGLKLHAIFSEGESTSFLGINVGVIYRIN